ncbi:sigma-70 family RNA polymerase sigma factor [Amycolatopsis sp. K13G38]|uniref:Sigma-70 family RNA polymerase sigma factor n=1 Tax=Amycolatopsis acididurans TaxID=2724524 RepID=A0ABX1IXF4_9PSEU|nr:sigma-70 family RNA polymerase sigma factor [Amycolatopsis acididurans]NKQ52129.1 sigma-70 family RNA polymerase sigma factor [Amycolatopsis acididurans]
MSGGAVTAATTTEATQPSLDDATLVARARDGDVHAYEELVRRYQGPMFRLALRMLGSTGDAEDIVQDVFLTVWRRLGQLQQDAAFVGWLYRTTTNRCLNAIRARRPMADVDPDTTETRRGDARPERAAEVSAQMRALLDALEQLTPQQRACWLLREVHGRSYEEIAAAVDSSTTAVRGRIARARAQLAEVMQPWR